jgi:hypothetical protein
VWILDHKAAVLHACAMLTVGRLIRKPLAAPAAAQGTGVWGKAGGELN